MNYEKIVRNYKAQFEGIANPVFYKKLYPTSNSNERSDETWSLYRFGQGLKKKSNDEEPDYFNENTDTYKLIGRLNEMRQQYQALREGTQREMWSSPHYYAFSRRMDDGENKGQEIICAFNNSSESLNANMQIRAESRRKCISG